MGVAGAEVIRSEVEVRILVVDDEPEIATMVAEALQSAEPAWQIAAETDPNRAMDRLGQEAFDCLITDLVMPSLGGLTLAEKARAINEDLALIALTGRGTLENSIQAMRLGFVDFIQKPFDLTSMSQAVCRTVRQHQHRQLLQRRLSELVQAHSRLETSEAQLQQKLQIAGHDLVLSSRRMARQLEDLAQAGTVARSLMGVVELEDLLGLCAALVSDRVSCQSSTVAVYEARQEAIGLMVRTHPGDETAPALCWLRTPLESGVLCRAAHTQKSIHIEAVAESTLLDPDENQWWPEGRLLVVPTPCRGQSVGVAVLHRPADSPDFSAQDLKHLTELAKLIGPAILTAKVHHQQRCAIYASLEAVAEATEDRSPGVKGHAVRVLAYAQQTVPALDLTQAQIGALQIAARLHDLGWVVVPDETVNHIGPLTESQWERVRRHPEAGANFLKPLDFFGEVGEIIRAHHESYDGTGYPDLKAGEEIPLLARLLAVADAFDAMTSPRPHRAAMSIDEALDQVQRLAGQQFDPRMAGALAAVPKEILAQIQASHR